MKDYMNNIAHEIKAQPDSKKHLKFRIASLNVQIDCLYGYAFRGFKEYVSTFQNPDIHINIYQEDIDKELRFHPEIIDPKIKVNDHKVTVTYDYGCLEPFIAMKKMADAVIPFNEILFHGAAIEKDGYAYIFTAPSGVGKSTRIALWKEEYPDSIIVNGDKPFIKINHDAIFACGSPWAGKEGWNTNIMVPIRAVFFLERAETDEKNEITEIGLGQAFPFLLQQVHYPIAPDAVRRTIELMKSFQGKIHFYRFHSAPTRKAIQLAYETARPR